VGRRPGHAKQLYCCFYAVLSFQQISNQDHEWSAIDWLLDYNEFSPIQNTSYTQMVSICTILTLFCKTASQKHPHRLIHSCLISQGVKSSQVLNLELDEQGSSLPSLVKHLITSHSRLKQKQKPFVIASCS